MGNRSDSIRQDIADADIVVNVVRDFVAIGIGCPRQVLGALDILKIVVERPVVQQIVGKQ